MKRLHRRCEKLGHVPAEALADRDVEDLRLGGNLLTVVPDALWDLPKLQMLDLSENRLTSLSERIGNLKHLRMLDVAHNRLVHLPAALWSLTTLTDYLYIGDNLFES